MRRFVTLFVLLLFTIPFGASISGCGKKTTVAYCEGGDSGTVVGQLTNITLGPKLTGISLNAGQFGQVTTPTGSDCKGNSVSISNFTYGTVDVNGKPDLTIADVNPANGRLCAGNWNRNTGGGIPDFTVCNVTGRAGTAYVVASAAGATSNPLAIYVHPVITSIVLGTPSKNCATDLASNCCPLANTGPPITAPAYDPTSCLSQGQTGQLAGRVFNGSTNISCNVTTNASGTRTYSPLVGYLAFTPQTPSIVTIDQNGVATATQPGSTLITAAISNAGSAASGSSAGFFSTCAPASITLSVPNTSSTSVVVNQSNTQPILSVVRDTKGAILNGTALQFVSTTPQTLPSGGAGAATPTFPGAGSITAVCLPPACNPAPLNEVGLFGNGEPLSSNPITITTPGTASTVLYAASTRSRYIAAVDFTTPNVGTPLQLPYTPNSMVISNDGSSIYLGSTTELMTYNALTNGVSGEFPGLPGKVLAVSPDNATLVIADTNRQQVYLATSAGVLQTSYGGLATRAQFTPDSQTVYITAGDQLLIHSNFTGWTAVPSTSSDVAVTVPGVGAYLAGPATTARTWCSDTTLTTGNGQTTATNQYYPLADTVGLTTERIAATNDGKHIVGAAVGTTPAVVDLAFGNTGSTGLPTGSCPTTVPPTYFSSFRSSATSTPLSGITATAINGVVPSSDSTVAMVTYTGSSRILPVYTPGAPGTVANVTLSGTTTGSPVSGVFSADNSIFFAGTAGDNQVHLVNKTVNGFVDRSTLAPKLPDGSGGFAPPDLLVQRPRKQN